MPIAAVINGSLFAVHADNLNTPRRLSNTSTVGVWQWKYSAFGDEQPAIAASRFADLTLNPNPGTTTVASVTFNLRYPGQYADTESGLSYNYFRSYDSGSGRYTQADPIGLDGGWNRFGYVEGNPLIFTDSEGLRRLGGNARQRRVEQRAQDTAETQRLQNYFEQTSRLDNLLRNHREAVERHDHNGDGLGALTGAGAEIRHPSVPNALEDLINPRRKEPWIPQIVPTRGEICPRYQSASGLP